MLPGRCTGTGRALEGRERCLPAAERGRHQRATGRAQPPPRHDACVATARAELSSITSTLTDLARRVTALAERSRDGADADLAAELFAVERDLRGALRRLERASPEGRSRRS